MMFIIIFFVFIITITTTIIISVTIQRSSSTRTTSTRASTTRLTTRWIRIVRVPRDLGSTRCLAAGWLLGGLGRQANFPFSIRSIDQCRVYSSWLQNLGATRRGRCSSARCWCGHYSWDLFLVQRGYYHCKFKNHRPGSFGSNLKLKKYLST